MLQEKVRNSADKYFYTMEKFDSQRSFGEISPWIFNFYKGNMVGATIMAEPPEIDRKQDAFMHILNLLTFDKFDCVTISMDTWFTKQPADDPDFSIAPSESLDKEEAIITLGATKDDIKQSMLIYGRDDDGGIYEKEHILEDASSFEGWMQDMVMKGMNFPVNMETLVYMAKENTDIFKGEDRPIEEIIHALKQEWIDLLTSNGCVVAFSEACTEFENLDGYDIVDFEEE
tara:strand:+ start:1326 stop:2015 length:690 start_codon:yes stop_codon:yes gene_type:complete